MPCVGRDRQGLLKHSEARSWEKKGKMGRKGREKGGREDGKRGRKNELQQAERSLFHHKLRNWVDSVLYGRS